MAKVVKNKENSPIFDSKIINHGITCKTIAMIQQALGKKIVEVVKRLYDKEIQSVIGLQIRWNWAHWLKHYLIVQTQRSIPYTVFLKSKKR